MKSTDLHRARTRKKKALKLLQNNKHIEALPLLESVCHLAPKDGEAWLMLGATHGHLGNIQAAIHCSEQAVSILPASVKALDNLALGYQHSGEIKKACSVWERRLALKPQHRDTVNRFAQGLISIGRVDKAIAIYQQYLKTHQHDHELLTNLGAAFEFEGALFKAEQHYRQALEIKPEQSITLQNLANVLSAQGKSDASINTYLAALNSNPNNSIARSNYLLNLHYQQNLSVQKIYREHVEHMRSSVVKHTRTFENELDKLRPLNIGFMSPDMRTHSVAYFFEPLLESIDRNEYVSYCYADVAVLDVTTKRLQKLSSHWRDITKADISNICNRIRNDKIDILIDMAGHTSSRNIAVFNAKPAPIQITWLGYPNTTGLQSMDYRITDTYADPVEDSTPCTEELVRLDGCFLCYKAMPCTAEVATLPAKNNGFVTFGSFNNLAKVNDQVLELWVKLLGQVTNAHLYLKNPSFTDESTRSAFMEKLISMGVSSNRINLAGRTLSTEEHLHLYSKIDIGLDTFPYNGTTTTCEALWMGVPVITKTGNAHAGRVGASLLNAANHSEWIAQDNEDFLQIAAKLAENINELSKTRETLRDDVKHSLLCDSKQFATRFTNALRNSWIKHCESNTR